MFDEYHETHFDEDEIEAHLKKYLLWCKENNQTPEVTKLEEVDENNISHVVYHADLQGL